MKPPLIKGGQGRTAGEVQETAAATVAMVFAGLMLGCALGFFIAGLGLFAAAFAIITIVATAVAYMLMACPTVEAETWDLMEKKP